MLAAAKRKSPSVHHKLLQLLGKVDRPGSFCVGGDWDLTLPGLEVQGLGPVGLPLTKAETRKLIKLCEQAPYGKGTETVVDTAVRRVWELDPANFELTNPKWEACVAAIVEKVQESLGLEKRKLTANLYKLLVYEKGSFFLPHRDGEKLDRMVATLVIGLPSPHEGGTLIVSHEGQQREFHMRGAAAGHELSYAAFYADCEHEVKPVRSGYRVCLTYNLTLAKARGKKGIAAPSYGKTVAAIAKLLTHWSGNADCDARLAITLEHRYTQDGLTLDTLKGIDRARADILFKAAEQADCVAHLALVTLWQCGSAEGGYDYSYGYGGRRHWSEYEDGYEDDDEDAGSDYEMGEVFEWSLSADHWSDVAGKRVGLGKIDLREEDIVTDEPLTESEPNEEDFEGYTGNAGMTLERWYHRAAVIVWPRANHYHILCDAGTDGAIGGFEMVFRQWKRTTKKLRGPVRDECLAFASAIIDTWQARQSWSSRSASEIDRGTFLAMLCELDAIELVHRFLAEVVPSDATVQFDKSFAKYCKDQSWASFERDFFAIFKATDEETVVRDAKLLRTLCTVRDKNADRIALCQRLAMEVVAAVKRIDSKRNDRLWAVRSIDRAEVLRLLVAAMLAVRADKSLRALIENAIKCKAYDLTDVHLQAIFALERKIAKLQAPSAAIDRWIEFCRTELERRTAEAPEKPADFRRPSQLSCTCRDCQMLASFLADPKQRQARFPLAKQRRRHLHDIITSNRCDCTHVTERRGRPFTLVCTKTLHSYKAALEVYQRDRENLKRLKRLA